ncbi:MAG: alpha/beta hydrolase [Proteobacteria bacterium]|nr:alpha/beta hydrolase [Pseudomonadota bacterium]
MFKKIGLGLLAFIGLVVVVTSFFYWSFRSSAFEALAAGSQIADTSAGPIEYQIVGTQGPTVLVLHGTPGGYDQAVSFAGMRVLSPSRPGYLRTPLSVGSTPTEQARAYAALLDALGIDKVSVMGISGGGPSSLAFASLYPARTSALIALEAVSQPMVIGEVQEEPPFLLQMIAQSDFLNWAVLSLMENFMGAEGIVNMMVPNPVNRQRILSDPEKSAQMESPVWSIWPISQRAAGQENDIAQFASYAVENTAIRVPALIIHGTEDINVRFSHSELLAEQIAGASFQVIEGGDHMMPFSHAEEVDARIEEFLLTHNSQ